MVWSAQRLITFWRSHGDNIASSELIQTVLSFSCWACRRRNVSNLTSLNLVWMGAQLSRCIVSYVCNYVWRCSLGQLPIYKPQCGCVWLINWTVLTCGAALSREWELFIVWAVQMSSASQLKSTEKYSISRNIWVMITHSWFNVIVHIVVNRPTFVTSMEL
jgi:hypothetical protein